MLIKRILHKRRSILPGLLATSILAITGLSCNAIISESTMASEYDPFITDRVVTVRITMEELAWIFCLANPLAEEYVKADMWYDGKLIPDVAVRPKGNSSLRSIAGTGTTRYSLKVDLNFFNAARNLGGVKKLNFNNGFSDPTLIREFLSYELFKEMGVPVPRASIVDLWVNNNHLGVYTMVEQVDKNFLSQHFSDDKGNLYKPEMPAAYLDWTEADLERQQASQDNHQQGDVNDYTDVNLGGGKLSEIMRAIDLEEPTEVRPGLIVIQRGQQRDGMPGATLISRGNYLEQMCLKTNENNPDHSALLHFLNVINNEPDETFPTEIEKVLDVDEVLRFIAVSTVIVHLDNYIGLGHNYYLYEVDGKFTIIPWDLNMSFGTFRSDIDRNGIINYYIDEPTAGAIADYPLVDRLLSYQPYIDTYHYYLEELLDGAFSIDNMNSRIDEIADLIRPYVEADELKFYSTEIFEQCLNEDLIRSATPIINSTREFIMRNNLVSPETYSCLINQLGLAKLEEMRTRKPTNEEMEKLKSCLSQEQLSALLQFFSTPQQPMIPGGGMTSIGLKTFVAERTTSIGEQLKGTRASSSGDGSGNGGTRGMVGGRNLMPGGLPLQ